MRILRIVPLFSALAAAPLAAQGVDGTIWFTSSRGNGEVDTLVQYTRGSLIRLETHGAHGGEGMGAAIIDSKAQTLTIMMPSRKMYMVTPIKPPSAAMQKKVGDISFVKTGQTETVAGVSCDVYHVSRTADDGKKREGDACFAKGVGLRIGQIFSSFTGAASLGLNNAAYQQLTSQDMHILKATGLSDKGEKDELVAIKIDRSSPPSSMFTAPSDYTKMEMPGNMPMSPP